MSKASNSPMSHGKLLTCAIGEIYAAVEVPALWPAVLDRILKLVEGDGAWLVSTYGDALIKDVQASSGTDPAMQAEFQAHYASRNVWAQRMDQMYPVGQVGYSHRAISDRELHKTEFYAGWLKPHNADYCLGVLLKIPDRPLALLSAVRCAKHGAFEDEQGRIVEALYPHLQRALRLHCELSALRSAKQGLEHALDAFDRAVFGLNANGKILFSNRMADRLLEESDGIYVNRKRLAAAGPAQDMELQALLGEIAKTGAGFSGMGALLIPRRSGKPALRVTLMPFAGNFLRHFPGLTTLVFIDDPAKAPSSRATSLRKLFHLSPTQARLAALLAGGFQLAVAAEQLHMTQETARFHLKSIFMKTGVKRQVDLVRLWLNLPGEVTGTRCDGSSPGA